MLEQFTAKAQALLDDCIQTIFELRGISNGEEFQTMVGDYASQTREHYFQLGHDLDDFHSFCNFEREQTDADRAVARPVRLYDHDLRQQLDALTSFGRGYTVNVNSSAFAAAKQRTLLHMQIVESYLQSVVEEFAISEEKLARQPLSITWKQMIGDLPRQYLPGSNNDEYVKSLYSTIKSFQEKHNWTVEDCNAFLKKVHWTPSEQVKPKEQFCNAWTGRLTADPTVKGEIVRSQDMIDYHTETGRAVLEDDAPEFDEDQHFGLVVLSRRRNIEACQLRNGDLIVFRGNVRELVRNVREEDGLVWFEYGRNTKQQWKEIDEGIDPQQTIVISAPATLYVRSQREIEQGIPSGKLEILGVAGLDGLSQAAQRFEDQRTAAQVEQAA